MPDNKLPITVPMLVHEDMAQALGESFAISYLCGAVVSGYKLRPRTRTAAERLAGNFTALQILREHGLTLGPSLGPHEREALPGREGKPQGGTSWQAPLPISREERATVGRMVRDFRAVLSGKANTMDFRALRRKPGETPAQQAERLWPNHRIDRMRDAGRL